MLPGAVDVKWYAVDGLLTSALVDGTSQGVVLVGGH